MPLSHRPRRAFRPLLEHLEERDAPAQLVVVSEPAFNPTGSARVAMVTTPFANGYGVAWDGHAEVAPSAGSAAGTFHFGSFTWNGFLDFKVQAEAGEIDGTPVHLFLSGGGRVTWDLDPKSAAGFTTNSISLSAGPDGETSWFELAGALSDPANAAATTQTSAGNGSIAIDTTIGSVIRLVVSASGNSDSWVQQAGSFRGTATADFGAGIYLPPDLIAGPLSWNTAGGIDFEYIVGLQSIDPNATPVAQLFWGDDSGPFETPAHTENLQRNRGTYLRHVNGLAPPPANATRLYLVLNGEQVTDEQGFDNNISSASFVHATTITATHDGDSRADVVGRFFSGLTVPGQRYIIQLSPDLAAFVTDSSQISVKLGTATLTVHPSSAGPGWDRLTYETTDHDPGKLTRDTVLQVRVLDGGRELARASATVDVEPLPAWLKSVRPLQASFDGDMRTYTFAGPLLSLSTGPRVIPSGRGNWLGAGGPNRVDVTANVQVHASIDPTRADLLSVTGAGRARGWYRGLPLFDVTDALDSGGPFNTDFVLNPRSLAAQQGSITLNLNDSATINNIFAGNIKKGHFRVTPNITADVAYTVAMTAKFMPDGRLSFTGSSLDFNFQGDLSGPLGPSINLGSSLSGALSKLTNVLGVPADIAAQIRNDLRGTTELPAIEFSAPALGELNVRGSVKFGGSGLKAATSLRSFHGLFQFVPTVSFIVTWAGSSFAEPNSTLLSRFFTINTTW